MFIKKYPHTKWNQRAQKSSLREIAYCFTSKCANIKCAGQKGILLREHLDDLRVTVEHAEIMSIVEGFAAHGDLWSSSHPEKQLGLGCWGDSQVLGHAFHTKQVGTY